MASVFLSYDREDAARARAIAAVLEQTGHAVWWDRHIKGGSQYSKEIEQALAAADAVVVLWSKDSIDSAWVRDEAAAGRDSGRLIPITIDGTQAPLGFRQFQLINLSGRRINQSQRNALSNALTNTIGTADVGMGAPSVSSPAQSAAMPFRPTVMVAVIMVVAIAVLATLVWQPWRKDFHSPLVAVAAAEPGPAAQTLAADLLVKLGVLQSAHADALQLVDANSRQTPDFMFKVGSGNAGGGAQANLMLVDNRAGTLLWSDEFTATSGKAADLRQQIAYSAANVLDCAVQALSAKSARIELPTLKLYLSGCANMSNLMAQDPRAAVDIFRKVTQQAPNFEGAWKKLLHADIQTLRVSGLRDPGVRRSLQNDVEQARRLHPAMAEVSLGEAWLGSSTRVADWLNLMQQALAKDPNNPYILSSQAFAKGNAGLMQESLADMRQAVRLDPLSPSLQDMLITVLLNIGQADAARDELRKSEQLWPGATNVLHARFSIEFRVGDPAQALEMFRSGQLGPLYSPTLPQARMAHESYLRARMAPSAANKERAISDARALYAQDPASSWVVTRALSEYGALDDLIAFLQSSDANGPENTTWSLFRTTFSSLHRDPRFMSVAARFGLVDYWTKTGKWPDFCADPLLPYDCKAEAAKLPG